MLWDLYDVDTARFNCGTRKMNEGECLQMRSIMSDEYGR